MSDDIRQIEIMQENAEHEGDMEVERILALPLGAIFDECRAAGKDPMEVIAEVDRVISAAKVEAYRRRMKLFV